MWFLWEEGLTLFDIPKDVVLVDILVFSNIFGWPEVNLAEKWNKSVYFRCLPFKLMFQILKGFSSNVFTLLDTTSGQNFSKTEQYLVEQGPKKPHKCVISYKKIENF